MNIIFLNFKPHSSQSLGWESLEQVALRLRAWCSLGAQERGRGKKNCVRVTGRAGQAARTGCVTAARPGTGDTERRLTFLLGNISHCFQHHNQTPGRAPGQPNNNHNFKFIFFLKYFVAKSDTEIIFTGVQNQTLTG